MVSTFKQIYSFSAKLLMVCHLDRRHLVCLEYLPGALTFVIKDYSIDTQKTEVSEFDLQQFETHFEDSKTPDLKKYFKEITSMIDGFVFDRKAQRLLFLGRGNGWSDNQNPEEKADSVLFGIDLKRKTAVGKRYMQPANGILRCFQRKNLQLALWFDLSLEEGYTLTCFQGDGLVLINDWKKNRDWTTLQRKFVSLGKSGGSLAGSSANSWLWNHVLDRLDWWSVKRNETDNSYELRLKTFDIRV